MTASPSTPRRQPTASTSISSTPATPSFEPSSQDLDDPTSTPTAYTRSNNPSTKTSAPAEDSDNEDEAPDYLRLLSTLNSKSKTSSTSGIVIPKRGEKDFEPTGFGGQSKLLERSREAMFQAVSGERRVGSRSLVRATWNASSRRARLLDVQGKIFETVGVIRREQVKDHVTGKTITKAWNELLPEEALFLAERGSLQIYQTEKEQAEGGEEEALVPMSLQQAFAMLMLPPDGSADEAMQQDEPLTREAYLIYAHLKRLGYVVQRASIVDAIRAAPISASTLAKKNNSSNSSGSAQAKQPLTASQALKSKKGAQADGIIADPQRPIKLTTIWDILLYIPRRMIQLGGDGVSAIARWIEWVWRNTMVELGRRISETAKKILGSKGATSGKTIGSLGLGLGLHKQHQDGRRFLGDSIEWDSYDAVFQSLQIVPSGHDFWLPSSDEPPTSAATTSPPAATDTIRLAPLKPTQRPSSDHLQPFYYAWRPATLYRKSHPPPPEFRIVILNARTTPVPSIWRFESIFAHIPMPGSDAAVGPFQVDGSDQGMSSEEFRERVEYEKQLKASNEAKNRAAYGKFSDGKQKFLRERAEARQLAAAQRRASNETGLRGTMMGKVLIRVISLDFTIVKSVARLFRHSPGCYAPLLPHRARFNHHNRNRTAAGANRDGGNGRGSTGNPFPPLKAGRRSVVVAVVDGSITTLLRFGEAEFAWWSLYGVQQEEGGQEAK